ncbi:hypothetical protein [Novosphingobium gossypii]|uniref:hypothetical protein n=1 Tax=Novosphingobium gossypii TaxID=1604774 RepID=UPI003D1DB050
MSNPTLVKARQVAAAHFQDAGRDDLARMILAGDLDDLPELAIASRALRDLAPMIERFERALAAYADEDFWGDGECYSALAFHDQGKIARAALSGEDILVYTAG